MEVTADNLERAVAQFYHSDAGARAQAHKWLTEAQNSTQAWAFVWELLQPDKSAEAQFYAATTLHMKVVKAWAEVPVDQYPTLKKQLLESIFSFSAGPKIVLNRLCIALSAYILQTLPVHWPGALGELTAALHPSRLPPGVAPATAAWILMQTLTVLPEEFQSSHLAQHQRALVRRQLQDNIPLVLSLLEEILSHSAASEVGHQGVLCTAAWLQLGVPMPDCERLAERLIEAVYAAATTDTGLVESALEALSSMMTHPDTHKYPASVLSLLARLLPLHSLLWRGNTVQEELVTSKYSLFVSIAESHSRLLLDTLLLADDDEGGGGGGGANKRNVMQLVHIVFECSNCPGVYPLEETTSQLAMGFWFILQDDMLVTDPEQQRVLLPLLSPVYRALAEAMLRKSMLPDDDDPAWTIEDREALRCYRQDVADTMMYCYSVLREELLAVLLARLEEALADWRGDGWRYLEACLHAWLAVAECVDSGEGEYLPRFMAAVQGIPFAQLDLRAVATALDAVGAYGEWINAHPAVLSHVIPLLVMGLGSAQVAPSATMALKDLTRDCQASMLPFATHILSASQEALRGGHLKLSESVRLMYTVGRVLAVLPVDHIMNYLNQLLMPYVEELQTLVEQEPSASVKGAILLRLKMIGMLFATLDIRDQQPVADVAGPVPRQPVQPVYLVLQRILPVLQATLHRWHSDTLVVQAVCSSLKHALTTLLDDSKPLLADMLALLVKSYQMQPSPPALDLARQFVVLYGREEAGLMHRLLEELCAPTLRLAEGGGGGAQHTDVLEGFFNLLAQILKKNPQLLASSTSIDLPAVFSCGVTTLGFQENPTIKASASFLVQFVTQSRELPSLGAVVQAQGEALVVRILRCIGGESPRNGIEPMADILLALNKKYCDSLSRWLTEAAAVEGFPSPRATTQQCQAFAKAVIRERANRRKLQETVREFSLVCRGLVGTDYAAQSSLTY